MSSVGRNSKLLLNVPPTRDGLLHDTDVARLIGFRDQLKTLTETNLSAAALPNWRVFGAGGAQAELDLGRSATISLARFAEDISKGQVVSRYTLYGADTGEWSVLSRGTTIGYARIDRFAPVKVRRLRLVIDDAIDTPEPVTVTV